MLIMIIGLLLLVCAAGKFGGMVFDVICPKPKAADKTPVDFKHEFKEKK